MEDAALILVAFPFVVVFLGGVITLSHRISLMISCTYLQQQRNQDIIFWVLFLCLFFIPALISKI